MHAIARKLNKGTIKISGKTSAPIELIAIILAENAVRSIAEKIAYTLPRRNPSGILFINSSPENKASGNKKPRFSP
jgi:hypothetical protein